MHCICIANRMHELCICYALALHLHTVCIRKNRPFRAVFFALFPMKKSSEQPPYSKRDCDTERYQRRKRQSPKRHICGGIRHVPRVACNEVQEPPRPHRRCHDGIHDSEDEPIPPIFQRGADILDEPDRPIIQPQCPRHRRFWLPPKRQQQARRFSVHFHLRPPPPPRAALASGFPRRSV